MLSGLNHLTFAVSDLARSLDFYESLLGCRLHARWNTGAYLSVGNLWLCLSVDPARRPAPAPDYTHYAFGIAQADFTVFTARLREHGVVEWKVNRSEGSSMYFLDPDGHQLEVHVGDLGSRIAQCRTAPYNGMQIFD